MAKKNMTLEEKLNEAIIKDGPYEVPGNWVWSNIGNVSIEIKNGTTIKQNKDDTGIKVTRIESLQNNTIDINRLGTIIQVEKLKEKDYYEEGDIALSHINSLEHVGKTALIEKTLLPLVHGMNLLRIRVNRNLVIPKFFHLYTRGYDYKDEVVDRINRAVNQVSLNQKNLSEIPFPIPPLKEQQRIVDRIESLFEKLDKAKELIEEAREGFEKRKSAVLEKAFRGDLTENSITKDIEIQLEVMEIYFKIFKSRYKLSNLEKIINEKPRNGYSPKAVEYETNTKTLKLGATTRGYFNPNEFKYIDEEIEKDSYLWLKKGDFLIQRANSLDYVGISAIYDMEDDLFIYPDLIMKFRVNEQIYHSKLLWYWINSRYGRWYFINNATGTAGNMPKINQKTVLNLPVPIIPLKEQNELVKILDKLLKEESKIEEITQLEEQIDLIKKSILAKAFRGKLGTNSEDEESALELLKEILCKQ